MISSMPALHLAMSVVEAGGEQGIEWLLMHAGLLKSPAVSARPSLTFEVVSAYDFTSPEYLDLHERSDATAFQHPIWLDRAFARLVDAADRSPAILVGRSACDAG